MSQINAGVWAEVGESAVPAVVHWCAAYLGGAPPRWRPIAGDAGLRRYYRLAGPFTGDLAGFGSVIAMDASAEGEQLARFVRLAQRFGEQGILVPRVLAHTVRHGFALIEDFGDDSLLGRLRPDTVETLYGTAMDTLLHWQNRLSGEDLPAYDQALLHRELALFDEWLVRGYLALTPSARRYSNHVIATPDRRSPGLTRHPENR